MLILNQLENPESIPIFSIDNVKFRHKVVPGDTRGGQRRAWWRYAVALPIINGLVFVGEKLVCEAEFMAQIVRNE